jgi:hypothetical protein
MFSEFGVGKQRDDGLIGGGNASTPTQTHAAESKTEMNSRPMCWKIAD